MPTKRPPPPPHRVGGIIDDIGDAFQAGGKYIYDHGDTIADVAETVVSVAYPAAAPIAAAEHKLRTGIELNMKEAKAATTAATQLGKAVAQNVHDQVAAGTGPAVEPDHDSIIDTPPHDDPEDSSSPAPSSSSRSRGSAQYQLAVNRQNGKSSSSSGLLLVAGLGLLLLLAGEL